MNGSPQHRFRFTPHIMVLWALLLSMGFTVEVRVVWADTVQTDSLMAPLFASEEAIEITLTGNLQEVFRDKTDDRPYRPATLTYREANGETVTLDLGIKTRGYFRRIHLNCDVPPIRFNFKKKQVVNTVFAGQDKLKLVTHCMDRKETYEQYTMLEYLIYKAYNELTDTSFKVRKVRITYDDASGKRKPITRFGFLIEDEDRLAERLGGRSLTTGVIHPEDTNRELANLMATFHYMIGNTDWTTSTFHNIKIVFVAPGEPPLAVPYDFDFAGLINTPYAHPDSRLRISSVRERRFKGYCRTAEEYAQTFAHFNNTREAIYAQFQDFPSLEERQKTQVKDYLDAFYKTINSPKAVKKEFSRMCQKR